MSEQEDKGVELRDQIEAITKDVHKNGQWFAKHQYERKPVSYDTGMSWNAARDAILSLVETTNTEARLDELENILHKNTCEFMIGWAPICEIQSDCPKIRQRIEELKSNDSK